MTTGILDNESSEYGLNRYSHTILDEAHVFTHSSEYLLPTILDHMHASPHYFPRLTLMSATISCDHFLRYIKGFESDFPLDEDDQFVLPGAAPMVIAGQSPNLQYKWLRSGQTLANRTSSIVQAII